MAKAAQMADSGCECAKLVIAATSTTNPDLGTRKTKLDAVNVQLLSPEEKAWYDLLIETTKVKKILGLMYIQTQLKSFQIAL